MDGPTLTRATRNRSFLAIGAGVLLLALLLAAGATQIPSDAGYAGAGPNFLPWLVSALMACCGVGLMLFGWRNGEGGEAPDFPPRWVAMAWVSAGLILNALLITYIGFIVSCALLFALASGGFRRGADAKPGLSVFGRDFIGGVLISAPVYWMFTKLLGLTLPGLTGSGWL